jgi:hypothetical protein
MLNVLLLGIRGEHIPKKKDQGPSKFLVLKEKTHEVSLELG